MKSSVLPLACCALLSGCAVYPSYPYGYADPNVAYPMVPSVPYPSVYSYYPYAYAYPPEYLYPSYAAPYWYPGVWIGGSYWHGSHRHSYHRPAPRPQGGGGSPPVIRPPGRVRN